MRAKFKCLKCGLRWSTLPGPTVCPFCGHDYVLWENHPLNAGRATEDPDIRPTGEEVSDNTEN